jgi:hypothetical protein
VTWNWLLRRRIRALLRAARRARAEERRLRIDAARRVSPAYRYKNALGPSSGRLTQNPAVQSPEPCRKPGYGFEDLE